MNELPYYQHPYGILPQPISKWIELKIVEPLYGFLELVGQYLENNFLNYPLYELKRTELFYLLKKLYRKEELDYFSIYQVRIQQSLRDSSPRII